MPSPFSSLSGLAFYYNPQSSPKYSLIGKALAARCKWILSSYLV
jgi:hypothetical protein